MFLSFKMQEDKYLISLQSIQEVVNYPQQITKVPLCPKEVVGLFNLRGQIVTLIAYKSHLGQLAIVIKEDNNLYALVVDEVYNVEKSDEFVKQSVFDYKVYTRGSESFIYLESIKDLIRLE